VLKDGLLTVLTQGQALLLRGNWMENCEEIHQDLSMFIFELLAIIMFGHHK